MKVVIQNVESILIIKIARLSKQRGYYEY
jgi:hypothetical protein